MLNDSNRWGDSNLPNHLDCRFLEDEVDDTNDADMPDSEDREALEGFWNGEQSD